MRILAINLPNIDLSYFTSRGLFVEVEHTTHEGIYRLQFLYPIKNEQGQTVNLYTPWVADYLENTFKGKNYDIIIVGWNATDYGDELKNTGGYTYHTPLSSGAYWCTVRKDKDFSNNIYAIHEMHHALCNIINVKLEHHVQIDQMDMTNVNGQWVPYYLNNFPDNPQSNYARTWAGIKPYLSELNAINMPTVTLERIYDWNKETVGKLTYGNWSCNTLELGYKQNQTNISAIPMGTYTVKWTFSPKFLKYTYELQNVNGRSGIRIHSANLYSQLLGCIALGRGYENLDLDGLPDLVDSRKTVEEFNQLLNKKDFLLVIK